MTTADALRLFIADDHPLLRIGLSLALHHEDGVEVVGQAENGFEAIEKIKELVPDVVLLDVDMPGLSGTGALRFLRRMFPDMTILMLSTYNDNNYVRDSMNAGADGYILKSVSVDNLMKIVRGIHSKTQVVSPYLLDLVVEPSPPPPIPVPADPPVEAAPMLTRREEDVLRCLARGDVNKEISSRLNLSIETVKTHMKSLFRKFNARNRLELVQVARAKNLIG